MEMLADISGIYIAVLVRVGNITKILQAVLE